MQTLFRIIFEQCASSFCYLLVNLYVIQNQSRVFQIPFQITTVLFLICHLPYNCIIDNHLRRREMTQKQAGWSTTPGIEMRRANSVGQREKSSRTVGKRSKKVHSPLQEWRPPSPRKLLWEPPCRRYWTTLGVVIGAQRNPKFLKILVPLTVVRMMKNATVPVTIPKMRIKNRPAPTHVSCWPTMKML